MSTINELPRISDVLFFEEGESVNYVRDAVTVASGTAASTLGQVLGQISKGAISAAANGGNTGNGTCTVLSLGQSAKVGVYQLKFTAAAAFIITDPNGVELSPGVNGAYTDAQINLTITAGGAAFVAGDGFAITVAAGSGKYAQLNPAAVDGSQNAAAILLQSFSSALAADTQFVAVTRGPAAVKVSGLQWTAGMTGGQITAAEAQLVALGIKVQSDYGV